MKVVENGRDTFLWIYPWVTRDLLCERFKRLFSLSMVKYGLVADIVTRGSIRDIGGGRCLSGRKNWWRSVLCWRKTLRVGGCK